MAPQAVARPFDVDDDSVVKEPIQQRGGDHGVREHLAPLGKATIGGQVSNGLELWLWRSFGDAKTLPTLVS